MTRRLGGLKPGGGHYLIDGAKTAAVIEPAEMETRLRMAEIGSLAAVLEGSVELLRHADAVFVTLALLVEPGGCDAVFAVLSRRCWIGEQTGPKQVGAERGEDRSVVPRHGHRTRCLLRGWPAVATPQVLSLRSKLSASIIGCAVLAPVLCV
ncbi:hypothetical protein [Halochromatium sp.]